MIPLLLSAGSATAAEVALKGGMSLIDGTFITALFVGLSSVITAIGTVMWCKNRAEKKQQKQRPLDSDDLYVRCAECAEHRKAINSRIDNIQPMLERISNQVEQSSSRAEERAVQLHRRLDPIVERVAANSAKIDVFEELARKSTLGKN
uniref:Uncharacterized protein n=1 Tax=uncultured bacterium fosmid pJB16B1 TaxID=1478054 RepID=A0A0H3U792_9BACT|nr:hypothetical protein [uncultured bacterium fosmid pJB16B1]